jgi:hypothetical protein
MGNMLYCSQRGDLVGLSDLNDRDDGIIIQLLRFWALSIILF